MKKNDYAMWRNTFLTFPFFFSFFLWKVYLQSDYKQRIYANKNFRYREQAIKLTKVYTGTET